MSTNRIMYDMHVRKVLFCKTMEDFIMELSHNSLSHEIHIKYEQLPNTQLYSIRIKNLKFTSFRLHKTNHHPPQNQPYYQSLFLKTQQITYNKQHFIYNTQSCSFRIANVIKNLIISHKNVFICSKSFMALCNIRLFYLYCSKEHTQLRTKFAHWQKEFSLLKNWQTKQEAPLPFILRTVVIITIFHSTDFTQTKNVRNGLRN